MAQPVRLAFIGCGFITAVHSRHLHSLGADAVRCALDVQRGMLERNADVPLEKRIEFRIGINVDDIITDRDDIFGDGVNVAVRLEGLAEPRC